MFFYEFRDVEEWLFFPKLYAYAVQLSIARIIACYSCKKIICEYVACFRNYSSDVHISSWVEAVAECVFLLAFFDSHGYRLVAVLLVGKRA